METAKSSLSPSSKNNKKGGRKSRFFYCLFSYPRRTHHRQNRPTAKRLENCPQNGLFFIALNKYPSQAKTSEKTPKERPKTASQEKTDGATNTQPPKTRTETGQKRTKATPTGKHSRQTETSRERAKDEPKRKTATKHGDKIHRRTPQAEQGDHEKRTAEAVPKKEVYPQGGVLASVSAVLYLPSAICRQVSAVANLSSVIFRRGMCGYVYASRCRG